MHDKSKEIEVVQFHDSEISKIILSSGEPTSLTLHFTNLITYFDADDSESIAYYEATLLINNFRTISLNGLWSSAGEVADCCIFTTRYDRVQPVELLKQKVPCEFLVLDIVNIARLLLEGGEVSLTLGKEVE